MSFALTTQQILNRTKTVTRRIGWRDLQPGTLIQAVEKGMGLKKGEKMRKLAVIRVVSVRRELLAQITEEEVAREGFPGLESAQFYRAFHRQHELRGSIPGRSNTHRIRVRMSKRSRARRNRHCRRRAKQTGYRSLPTSSGGRVGHHTGPRQKARTRKRKRPTV